MKSDTEIMKILHLPSADEFDKAEQKKMLLVLHKRFIESFKIGYKYGLLANASHLLDESLKKKKVKS